VTTKKRPDQSQQPPNRGVAQNIERIQAKIVIRRAKRDVSIEQVILALLEERGAGKTICPSEAARRAAELAGTPSDWRNWMKRPELPRSRWRAAAQLRFSSVANEWIQASPRAPSDLACLNRILGGSDSARIRNEE
jgi:hypothetical protein